MWKKVLTFLLVLVLGCSVVACKKNPNPNNPNGDDSDIGVTETSDWMVKNGVSPYKVVYPSGADEKEQIAYQEFVGLFSEATGVKLQAIPDTEVKAGDKYISVGRTQQLEQSGLTVDSSVGRDGYQILSEGKNTYLIGGGTAGTVFAVYGYMERLFDYKCYTADLHTLNSVESLKLYEFEVTEKPAIPYRYTGRQATQSLLSQLRMFNSGDKGDVNYAGGGHTFYILMPPSKYADEHPEWYSGDWQSGGDGNWQLCVSNYEMRDALVEELKAAIETRPDCYIYPIQQNDGGGHCTCENCHALAEKYGSVGGAYIDMMNYISKKLVAWLKETGNPKADTLLLQTFAYTFTEAAPVDANGNPLIVAEDNVCVYVAPITAPRAYAYNDMTNNSGIAQTLLDWQKVAKHINMWSYDWSCSSFMQPFNMFGSVKENYRYMQSIGCEYFYEEAPAHGYTSNLHELKDYVESRLLWDNTLDVNVLIDDFCHAFYGEEAGDYIIQYIDTLEVFFRADGSPRTHSLVSDQIPSTIQTSYYKYNFVKQLDGYFVKALEANEKLKDTDENYEMYKLNIYGEKLVTDYIAIELYSKKYDTDALLDLIDEFETWGTKKGMQGVYLGAETGTFEELISSWKANIGK